MKNSLLLLSFLHSSHDKMALSSYNAQAMAHSDFTRCPHCFREGPLGELCPQEACTSLGFHFVPASRDETPQLDSRIGQKFGDFLATELIGSGGFGRVYHAIQFPVGLLAAIKVLDLESGTSSLNELKQSKFELEAKALAQLSHPNIVRLYHYGFHQNTPYLAMELIQDATNLWGEIEKRAENDESFSLSEIESILMQSMAALQAAHDKGLIHRDIKPENIMLQNASGHGIFVKLLDFGLAKFMTDPSATSILLGTPAYMAPEQLRRERVGPWTDIYALGIILFELLTGYRPFPGQSVDETIRYKLDPLYDPWSRIEHLHLPLEARAFFSRSISMDYEGRYLSIKEMREGAKTLFQALKKESDTFYVNIRYLTEPTAAHTSVHIDVPLPSSTRRMPRPSEEDLLPAPTPLAAKAEAKDKGVLAHQETTAVPSRSRKTTIHQEQKQPASWPKDAKDEAAIKHGAAAALSREDQAQEAHSETREVQDRLPTRTASRVSLSSPVEAPSSSKKRSRLFIVSSTILGFLSLILAGIVLLQSKASIDLNTAKLDQGPTANTGAPMKGSAKALPPVFVSETSVLALSLPPPPLSLSVDATEVTQGEWAEHFESRPSHHRQCGPSCPLESVSWWNALAFANARSLKSRLSPCYKLLNCKGNAGEASYHCESVSLVENCLGWRLPSREEWDYLAQSFPKRIEESAWSQDNSGAEWALLRCHENSQARCATHPVASRKPNALGLYDMYGNVREWLYDEVKKEAQTASNPLKRQIRGGSFLMDPKAFQKDDSAPPMSQAPDLGFRLVRTAE